MKQHTEDRLTQTSWFFSQGNYGMEWDGMGIHQ